MAEANTMRALYSPSRGEVGCVLIQAAFGGNRRVCHMFHPDWFLAPVDDAVWITASREEWETVAAMPKAERLKLGVAQQKE